MERTNGTCFTKRVIIAGEEGKALKGRPRFDWFDGPTSADCGNWECVLETGMRRNYVSAVVWKPTYACGENF